MCLKYVGTDVVLKNGNKVAVYRLQSWAISQHFNQTQLQASLKNCVFGSNEEFYPTLTLFSRLHKCQFVNNRWLFFTIHSKMRHKADGNQIHGRGLSVYAMKVESTAGEMF